MDSESQRLRPNLSTFLATIVVDVRARVRFIGAKTVLGGEGGIFPVNSKLMILSCF